MYQEKFNPNTKIRFKTYNTLRDELLPYVDFLKAGQTSKEVEPVKLSELSETMIAYARDMKSKAHSSVTRIKEQLIRDFYNLSNEEFDEISVQEFETMFKNIEEARKAEIDFLLFNTLSSKV